MRFQILAGALAIWGAVGMARAEPAAASPAGPVLDACLTAAPDLGDLAAAAHAAGGVAAEDTSFAEAHASIENPNHLGLWRGDRGRWVLGVSEGVLGGLPARACYATQSSETVPHLLERISQRFPLFEVMGRTSAASGQGVRETYAVLIDGESALVIVEWSENRATAYPAVTVVTFPRGLGPSETRADTSRPT